MYNLSFIKGGEPEIIRIKVLSDYMKKGRDLLQIEAYNAGYTAENSIFEFDDRYLFNFVYLKLTITPKSYLIDNLGNKFYITKLSEKEQLIKDVYHKLIDLNKNISYDLVKSIVERCYKEYKEE